MDKILLHGCTNKGSTNFGDFLFADLLYTYIDNYNKNGMTRFWRLSKFFKTKLFSTSKEQKFNLFQMDALIYIPGGYFGERQVPTAKSRVNHFIRYMPIGILAALLHKPIAIIGVGAGPNNSWILKKVIRFILNRAAVITVRDEESKQHLLEIGVNKEIKDLSDLILSLNLKLIPKLEKSYLSKIKKVIGERKVILVHYNNNRDAKHKFAEAIKIFLEKHDDYGIIISSDCVIPKEEMLYDEFKRDVNNQHILLHKYNDPWELCAIINLCDIILTTKLHVGIVGTRLSKSVLSFPVHKDKTVRLYKQLNESHRCIPLDATDANLIAAKLEAYHDKGIITSQDLYNASNAHWDYLKAFLDKLD